MFNILRFRPTKIFLPLIASIAFMTSSVLAQTQTAAFGPSNPFYAPSTLPFKAPPFDKIKDTDYQAAIEAGMAQQIEEIRAIADNPAPPTFDNTLVAMEKTGVLFQRATAAFDAVTGANTNPTLQKAEEALAPRLAAHHDAIYLNPRLFSRVQAVYDQRDSLHLDPEAQRLLEIVYKKFVHAGANLSDADKAKLKKLNEEESTLSNAFKNKLLAATRDAAFVTPDKAALAGMSDAEIAAAAQTAKSRNQQGYVIPLQNTTQQPALTSLTGRATRQSLFEDSWTRAERGDDNDTRAIIARLAQLRAEKAKLLGFPNYAAWKLDDQMAKTPEAALKFMDDLVPPATANAQSEAKEIQVVIDSQRAGFKLEPWDWQYYAEQVRKAKYELDESQVKPYFELDQRAARRRLLRRAPALRAHLQGAPRHSRLPAGRARLRGLRRRRQVARALLLRLLQARQQERRRVDERVRRPQSRLLGTKPVVYNVANFPSPRRASPRCSRFDDVTTMFHEFGHALHGMFSNVEYPSLSGTARRRATSSSSRRSSTSTGPASPRSSPTTRSTTRPASRCPPSSSRSSRRRAPSTRASRLTELLAAALLDMAWHTLAARLAPRKTSMPSRTAGARAEPHRLCRSSRRATAPVTSRTSGAADTPPATTPICGARCSTTTPTSGSSSTAV